MNYNLRKISLSLVTLSLWLSMTTPLVFAEVAFTEDFTEQSEDWIFYGYDYHTNRQIPHNWTVVDGTLGSFGTFGGLGHLNFACHETGSSTGPWSFDVFQPEYPQHFGFRISHFPNLDTDGYESDPKHFQFVHGGTDGMSLSQYINGQTWIRLAELSMSKEDLRGLRHFVIERDEYEITVSANDTTIFTGTLDPSFVGDIKEYTSICLWSETGGNNYVDNIKVVKVSAQKTESLGGSILNSVVGAISIQVLLCQRFRKYKVGKLDKINE